MSDPAIASVKSLVKSSDDLSRPRLKIQKLGFFFLLLEIWVKLASLSVLACLLYTHALTPLLPWQAANVSVCNQLSETRCSNPRISLSEVGNRVGRKSPGCRTKGRSDGTFQQP